MKKSRLLTWTSICDTMAYDCDVPHITLSKEAKEGFIYCDVFPSGRIKFELQSGGGHGESHNVDQGRNCQSWLSLIREAEKIGRHYFEH